MVRRGIGFILLVVAAGAFSDAITVGDRVYEDVFIERDQNHYFIHLPDEGRVVKVSRKRQDVSSPIMEKDPALRKALRQRFEENRPEAPRELETMDRGPLSNAAVERHHRVRELALFEAQLDHWRGLTQQQRSAVDNMLIANALGEAGDYMNSIEAMGGDTSSLQARLEAITRGEDKGTAAGKSSPGAGSRVTPRRGSTTSRESVVRRTEGDASTLKRRALDGTWRIVELERRLDELNNAVSNGYEARLTKEVVSAWEGASSKKTAPFTVEAPFWRLDCLRDDFGQSGAFSVTVYDAETDRPFTRLSDVDFLQMRVRVLDGPGRYYLMIEQDESGIPYEIRAVTFSD